MDDLLLYVWRLYHGSRGLPRQGWFLAGVRVNPLAVVVVVVVVAVLVVNADAVVVDRCWVTTAVCFMGPVEDAVQDDGSA